MTKLRIDLRSDTKTRPTPGMRAAMAEAEVGDEQADEDPSVNSLCERVAALLGKEAALFLPSGTMCNQIAILVHCRPGDEIIAAEASHILSSESAGAAALAGAQIRPLGADRGIFTAEQVASAIRSRKQNAPVSRLVHIEQTVNRGGGAVWPLATIEQVAKVARDAGLSMHMDGARLLNAVAASGTTAARFGACFDSLWLDLSKGLGCPVGAILAGDKTFIRAARSWKFRLGGAMRQAGILAAAGLYALDHHVERLSDDHDLAHHLAGRLAEIKGIRLPYPVETNLVFLDVAETGKGADALSKALAEQGIGIGVEGKTRLRAVTHLDVDRAGVDEAVDAIARWLV
ncbi:MAG: threonine aldolase [Rhodospirillales bacterium]|nr:threonine aldolase [Rhodospirillales bacterium]